MASKAVNTRPPRATLKARNMDHTGPKTLGAGTFGHLCCTSCSASGTASGSAIMLMGFARRTQPGHSFHRSGWGVSTLEVSLQRCVGWRSFFFWVREYLKGTGRNVLQVLYCNNDSYLLW